jgi:hypothetical protein
MTVKVAMNSELGVYGKLNTASIQVQSALSRGSLSSGPYPACARMPKGANPPPVTLVFRTLPKTKALGDPGTAANESGY